MRVSINGRSLAVQFCRVVREGIEAIGIQDDRSVMVPTTFRHAFLSYPDNGNPGPTASMCFWVCFAFD